MTSKINHLIKERQQHPTQTRNIDHYTSIIQINRDKEMSNNNNNNNKREVEDQESLENQSSRKKVKEDESSTSTTSTTTTNKKNVKKQSSKVVLTSSFMLGELPFEQLYLDNLPNSQMYEKSYMHKDACSHVLVSKTDYIITADILGYIKFWKKQPQGIEFVKTFRSHQGLISSISVSHDGLWLCSIGLDKNVRIFDVINFDVTFSFKTTYLPLACQWIYSNDSSKQYLAISSRESSDIYIYNPMSEQEEEEQQQESSSTSSSKTLLGGSTPIQTLSFHKKPVHLIKFNTTYQAVISIDIGGGIEYWSCVPPFDGQIQGVEFEYKMDTDLYDLQKSKATPQSLNISANGKYLSIMANDKKIRIFNFTTGKLHRVYDESFDHINELQRSEDPTYYIEPTDFGRRMAVERDIDSSFENFINNLTKLNPPPQNNILFDESNNFLIYSNIVGIKIINMVTNKVVRVLGKIENSTRFLGLALYQGKNSGDATLGTKKRDAENDPTIFCLAYKKQRFYMLSRREPEDTDNPELGRDVFNEKVTKDEMLLSNLHAQRQLPRNAVIHTTLGDIHCQLFPDECPKTVENFTTHSKNGYYDGIIFHRVIKNFMVQTGDPLGDGTGGTSIWNKDFEDEFNRNLRHDRPFTLSMANAGPGTNGSQFFITTVPVTRLDNKHTVFGRVYKGMEVVLDIEKVKTDKNCWFGLHSLKSILISSPLRERQVCRIISLSSQLQTAKGTVLCFNEYETSERWLTSLELTNIRDKEYPDTNTRTILHTLLVNNNNNNYYYYSD
ncbi:WD40 repeat-containing protein [Cavenderia fasciculata]|uniref:peptidylprolyl isomerase n=1 Tax=Cavenderia fasciculata TaxID=261658 RepID=F4QE90_CACFS|nr:WD40 repeat-containing protein [Cavenderia fasciculata]EGG14037.1 WD40 repeat-containing protein [Cavenderia fasciculata]|eukprot:XP_004350745.1 WD40 repeat-containing protein [Cavenderia fasciculata]